MFRNHWLLQLSQRWFVRGNRRHRWAPRVLGMKRRDVKPMLEVLEDRLVLSATITDLGILPGYKGSEALGLNSSGQVVGQLLSTTSGLVEGHAFLYSNDQMTDLGTLPGDTSSVAYGLNSSGQVVGESQNISGDNVTAFHAFLYSNGQMTKLPLDAAVAINDSGQIAGSGIPPSSSSGADQAALYSNGSATYVGSFSSVTNFSSATGTNASGQVIGFSDAPDSSNIEHAFLYSNGELIDLGTLPGDTESIASGINDSGQVVGWSGPPGGGPGAHAFLYSNGQMTDLGTLPGGTQSIASGINDSGQVVGESISSKAFRAFLYSNGQMIDLNTLLPANSGWELTDATAINDAGQIVGDGTINGQTHAFLLNLNVSLSPASLPAGIVNSSYTQAITANGGTGDKTLTYTVTSGAIPNGLTFTPNPNELDISGTPTAAGTVTFTVKARDSATPAHSITQMYTLTVAAVAPPPAPPASPSPPAPASLAVPPLLAFFDSLLAGTETVNADGTATVTDSFFGIPLLVATFDSSGNLESVTWLGMNITSFFE